jgi:hypothetical protein
MKPGVLVEDLTRSMMVKEFGDYSSYIGIGDQKTDHDSISICKLPKPMMRNEVNNVDLNSHLAQLIPPSNAVLAVNHRYCNSAHRCFKHDAVVAVKIM